MRRLSGEEKARYIGAMFARIVPRYDLMNALMTFGRDAAWRASTVRLAAPPPGGLALDLATGTGDLALALAGFATRPRVVAVDFCPEMLRVAQRKAWSRGLAARIHLVLGDAMCLPLPEATFNCATMGFALRNVTDIPQTLAEIYRVLRPGGRFANLELTPPRSGLLAALFRLYFYRGVPLVGGLISGDLEAYTYLPHSLTHFPRASELATLMREAGFSAVSYRLLAAGTIAIHVAVKR